MKTETPPKMGHEPNPAEPEPSKKNQRKGAKNPKDRKEPLRNFANPASLR
jgi:hypothetical protein